jgi:hypothetical protein
LRQRVVIHARRGSGVLAARMTLGSRRRWNGMSLRIHAHDHAIADAPAAPRHRHPLLQANTHTNAP